MKTQPSLFPRAAILLAGEALLLWGLWWGMGRETAAVNQAVSEISDLKDPSPFRAALMGHLGKIRIGLQGYLCSQDASLLKQVADSRQDFEASLPEFAHQNPSLFPPEAAREIRNAFDLFKEAVDRTLEANTRRLSQWGVLEQNFTRILFLIEHKVRPLIRKDQPDGEERSEAILNIENQLRAWQQNLVLVWAQPSDAAKELTFENDNRGESYLDLYGRMQLLPVERKTQREILTLWKANSHLARESVAIETNVSQTVSTMDAQRSHLTETLNHFLPVMPPAQLEIRKQEFFWRIRLHTAAVCLLAFLGLVSLVGFALVLYRQGRRYLFSAGPAPSGLTFQMDLKGVVTSWSVIAEELYGYRPSEMLGQSIVKLFESESEINRLYAELQAARQIFFETTHKTKPGASLQVRIEFRPIAGHPTTIGIICTPR
ncbi:MAG: PAS domain-containing protein [Elusimicrobiota bacterium]|jgi:PAS domain S-box-containing protein